MLMQMCHNGNSRAAKITRLEEAPLELVITFESLFYSCPLSLHTLCPLVITFLSYISLSFSIVFLYVSKVMTNSKGEPTRIMIFNGAYGKWQHWQIDAIVQIWNIAVLWSMDMCGNVYHYKGLILTSFWCRGFKSIIGQPLKNVVFAGFSQEANLYSFRRL